MALTHPPTNCFLGDATGDDPIWISYANFDQVRELIEKTDEWTLKLNDFLGGKKINLQPHVIMRVSLREKSPQSPDAANATCVVQGIVGTNFISVQPFRKKGLNAAFAGASDPWLHWEKEESAGGPRVDALLDLDSGLGFSHMELSPKGDAPEVRAMKIAAFVMLAADKKAGHKGSYHINRLLKNRVNKTTRTGGVPDSKTTTAFKEIEPFSSGANAPLDKVQFTISCNNAGHGKSPLAPGLTSPAACENMSGPLVGQGTSSTIDVEEVVIKNYA